MSDIGASTHMNSHEINLTNLRPHTCSNNVLVGNGKLLRTTHVGDTSIGFGDTRIVLYNLLLVPKLEINLLFIGQLTFDYLINCEFINNGFVIKDRVTSQVLMRGIKHGNLYLVCASPIAIFSTRFRAVTSDIWHSHLGHPQAAVIAHLCQSRLIQIFSNKATPLCESC